MLISEIIAELEKTAPTGLALDWDNVGLLLGEAGAGTERVLVTLDVTKNAVDKAVRTGCQLIVSHHPLFLRPLKRITNPLILRLAKHGIAVYCAHTNLDIANGGVNHALAARLGLSSLSPLSHESGSEWLHVAVYVPREHATAVADAAHNAGAGVIGRYAHCMNRVNVEGQYMPLEGSSPFAGEEGELEWAPETKLEFFCDSTRINAALSAVRAAHPYETPVIGINPQRQPDPNHGLGLVGELEETTTLRAFAATVCKCLGAPAVKMWPGFKSPDAPVKRVAVCGGSGGTLIRNAKLPGADVFVLGESNYHGVLDSPLPLLLAGHFHTEQPVVETLAARLESLGLNVEQLACAEHEIDRLEVIVV